MKRQSPDCLREHTGAILNHSERRLRPKKCTNIWKQMRRCAQPKPLASSATHTPPATVKTGPPNQVLCMQPRLEMGRNEGEERVWEAWLLNNLYLFNTGKAAWSRGLNSCVCRMCVCVCVFLMGFLQRKSHGSIWLRHRLGDGLMKDAQALEQTNHRPRHAVNVNEHVYISNCLLHIWQWLCFNHPK